MLKILILNNLRYYLKSYLGIFAAIVLGAGIITGALFVGDSIRESLIQSALNRTGWSDYALYSPDRSFNISLPQRLESALKDSLKGKGEVKVAGGIKLAGSVARADNSFRANKVNVYGVKPEFFPSAFSVVFSNMPADGVMVNKALAEHARLNVGDEIIVRVQKPSLLSLELPLTLQDNAIAGFRLRVYAIAPDNEMGNFSLQVSQISPFNLFMHYEGLSKTVEMTNRANLLLCGLGGMKTDLQFLNSILNKILTADDCQIEVWQPLDDTIEIRSKRIFIESGLMESVERLVNSGQWKNLVETNSIKILTYLVNLFEFKENRTPYSIIVASVPPFVDSDIKDDEIVITEWLAEDLGAKVGDTIRLQYYLPESATRLVEATNHFKVAKIVPHSLPWFDRTLLPDIPGLSKAESTQDWNLGFPLIYKFRKKDDDYWKKYRGTPKAFVSLSAGKKMWQNRFGEITALRFKIKQHARDDSISERFASQLIRESPPSVFGFSFIPIRENAINSAMNSQDFGGLFLGFSLFLIAASILLMTLLFQLNIERRMSEIATYVAIGFTNSMVRKIFLIESAFLILPASLLGAVCGGFYAKLMLAGLSTVWSGATAGFSLWSFHYEPGSFIIGVCATIVVCFFVIFLSLKRLKRYSIREIFSLSGSAIQKLSKPEKASRFLIKLSFRLILSLLLAGSGIVVAIFLAASNQTSNAIGFFISGTLLLVSGLFALPIVLKKISAQESESPGIFQIALRSSARNPNRSLLTSGILACGFFIIISISIFRLDEGKNIGSPSSGAGGFELIGESAIPIVKDLNSDEGLNAFGIERKDIGNARIVQFRVKEGDEASCLNLARAQKPKILGVDWKEMTGRFTFSMIPENYKGTNLWELLDIDPDRLVETNNNETFEIPAIGDSASIQWAIGKKLGDTLDYTDETGRPFKIKIVAGVENSILQGNLIISEKAFKKLFPSRDGYQYFLIDVDRKFLEKSQGILLRAFSDYGLELTLSSRRLAEFNAVQNTYIMAFQALGGLGLILGIIGISIILIRNVMERRNELAILIAIGFLKSAVKNMVIIEHLFLILIGMAIGIVSSLIAVSPALVGVARELPAGFIIGFLIISVISGYFCTLIASNYALKGRLIEALRTE